MQFSFAVFLTCGRNLFEKRLQGLVLGETVHVSGDDVSEPFNNGAEEATLTVVAVVTTSVAE